MHEIAVAQTHHHKEPQHRSQWCLPLGLVPLCEDIGFIEDESRVPARFRNRPPDLEQDVQHWRDLTGTCIAAAKQMRHFY